MEEVYLVGGNMVLPFRQIEKDGLLIREFSQEVDSDELVWHRDRNDRWITILEGSGWQLQLDNNLPQLLEVGGVYFIPAGHFHRVIRGESILKISIKE